jgi:DNA-binding MarR family transcriptional regulator
MPARLSYQVGRLDRLLRHSLADALAEQHVSLSEYTALSVLRERSRLSNAELARRSLVTPQSMNEVLTRLESRRLVRRSPDPDHGRVRAVELTAAGNSVLQAADASVDRVERGMLKGLSAAERRVFSDLLASACHALRELP